MTADHLRRAAAGLALLGEGRHRRLGTDGDPRDFR